MISKARAGEIVSLLLNASKSDEAFISMNASESTSVQFANNTILRAVSSEGITIQVTIRKGKQYGTATGNQTDADSLQRLMRLAEQQTGRLPEHDAIVPFPGATEVREAPMSSSTRPADSWRMEQAAAAIDEAKKKDLLATGVLTTSVNSTALASSNGLFLFQPSTPNHLLVRILNRNGSSTGFRERHSYDSAEIDAAAVALSAIAKCRAWSYPKEIKAERLTTIFEPQAFAEMLLPYFRQFDYTAYKERRSFLTKLDGSSRQGETLFDPWITVTSDPYLRSIASMPFSTDGTPVTPRTWINKGVIETVALSRFEADAQKKDAIPFPTNFTISGGDERLDAMIASTKRGLLVTGFASLNVEDVNNCLVTGSTRDGLFMIEDGKITGAVSNLLIRETPIYLLKRKDALGIAEKTSPKNAFLPMLVPPIRVEDVMYERHSGLI